LLNRTTADPAAIAPRAKSAQPLTLQFDQRAEMNIKRWERLMQLAPTTAIRMALTTRSCQKNRLTLGQFVPTANASGSEPAD
jgi:hypothetical protein